MTRARTRTIALAVAGIGVAVLAVAGFALRDAARERYIIWRLETGDAAAQQAAIERLEEIGSARSIPALLEALKADLRDGDLSPARFTGTTGTINLTKQLWRPKSLYTTGDIMYWIPMAGLAAEADRIGNAVKEIAGRSFGRARPLLERGLADESWKVRSLIVCVLYHLEKDHAGLNELLEKAARDEYIQIRAVALDAIASRRPGEPVSIQQPSSKDGAAPAGTFNIIAAFPCPICQEVHWEP